MSLRLNTICKYTVKLMQRVSTMRPGPGALASRGRYTPKYEEGLKIAVLIPLKRPADSRGNPPDVIHPARCSTAITPAKIG